MHRQLPWTGVGWGARTTNNLAFDKQQTNRTPFWWTLRPMLRNKTSRVYTTWGVDHIAENNPSYIAEEARRRKLTRCHTGEMQV